MTNKDDKGFVVRRTYVLYVVHPDTVQNNAHKGNRDSLCNVVEVVMDAVDDHSEAVDTEEIIMDLEEVVVETEEIEVEAIKDIGIKLYVDIGEIMENVNIKRELEKTVVSLIQIEEKNYTYNDLIIPLNLMIKNKQHQILHQNPMVLTPKCFNDQLLRCKK